MDETQAPVIPQAGIGTTALGRLQMRVPDDDGYDDVVVERRWPDMAAARAWCERTVLRASVDTTILEIQVFEECWRRPKSWETIKNRPVAEALQLGVMTPTGRVRWAEPRPLSSQAGVRYLL
jgi:hypothetical protein